MILGRPVAATSVNGVPELVKHGETGLLSPPRQPQRLAENILWLLKHPAEAQSMARLARDRTLSDFGAKRMVERIEALYETLLVKA
jgi:glycosyltransferase involved in cell wall biosynthesis